MRQIHQQRRNGADGTADREIQRAEADHDCCNDCDHNNADKNRNIGILISARSNELLILLTHFPDHRIGGGEIEHKLPAKEIEEEPTAEKDGGSPHDFHSHETRTSVFLCLVAS